MSVNVPLRTVYAYDLLSAGAIGCRVDAAIESALRSGHLIGGQIRVALDGQVIYQRDVGVLDPAHGTPVAADSVFRLSCLSRLLVSVAAMALVGEGRLSLDEDIHRWLPDFTPLLADGSLAVITVRQLLSHCAGFPRRLPAAAVAAEAYQDASVADDTQLPYTLRQLGMASLRYRPGSAWGYSMASDVLAGVIAQFAGGSLEAALQRYVIGPLQLRSTGYVVANRPGPGPVFVKGQAVHPLKDGILSCADDYLLLLEALRQDGGVLLPKVLIGEMAAIQTGDLQLQGWPGRGFGLGFTVLRDPLAADSPESIGTWRLHSAGGHSWFVDPLKRLSGVALTNTAGNTTDSALARLLRNAVYGV
ncbi:serine hydrolase domain-containing protein [Pseudomonas sp. MWU16-30317]|uniref:serine hydrolase domain-containing protein n=1 Tax=Pseudomonas sp. MWU16-30317 TaxID=2878095 RepID=UPI001CFBC456|nr:serine hydrolase domain-containing protein [Pseudomonas sp. MWU16-30317]